ncbi:MAG: tetratricopeptide repeat protein [Mariprofundaceae bacterium]
MILLSTSTLYAQPIKELLDEAIQDYQFQDFDIAETKFRSIINQAPGNVSAHYYLGVILTRAGKFDEAIKYLEHVANAPVSIAGIDQALAQAYTGANQFKMALPLNKKLYESNPESDPHAFQYALTLQKTGAGEDAKALYRQIISRNSSYAAVARYQIGEMLYNEGAYVSAVKEFEAIDPNSPYGDAAKAYIDALKPVTRPLNVYLSTEYFYNDNVNSGGAQRLGTAPVDSLGSQGTTLIGAVNSRQFEISSRFRLKLGYLYYGILHTQNNGAKNNDFIGHFINPEISFHPNRKMNFKLKGDLQFFNFGHQKLSNNYGATLTATRHLESRQGSANLHAAYLKKSYTDVFTSSGTTQSLTYLDANTWSVGAGGSYTGKEWPVSLTLDYTFNLERTIDNETVNTESIKAQESASTEHAVTADVTIPFTGVLSRLSLLGNVNYSRKNYDNVQNRQLYTDVVSKKVDVNMLIWGVKAQVSLWSKFGLTGSLGYEQTRSSSNTASLTYESRKYFGQISAAY